GHVCGGDRGGALALAHAARGLLGAALIDVERADGAALLRETQRDAAPDSRAGASDNRGPAFECVHARDPCRLRAKERSELVPRTRSSHTLAANPIANFGFKRGTRIITLLVSL